MKLATYQLGDEVRVGILQGGQCQHIIPFDFGLETSEVGVIAAIEVELSGHELESMIAPGAASIETSRVRLLAPIPRPRRNIFCVGKNYHEHAREFAGSGYDSSAVTGEVPEAPIIFSKVPETVIGNGADINCSRAISSAIDYEAELAVIIGRPGHCISKDDALDHVWGYTAVNDVTARDWQSRHQQWLLGKSFPNFCPMGPIAVTRDELDLQNTLVRSYVNGELRQQANTRDFIFDVPTVIECLSTAVPLQTGDIIATGTPAGVGIGFDPPKFLRDGDRVVVEVEGIGKLENSLRNH